jgi:hypothetical protein
MVAADMALVLTIILMGLWALQPFGQVMLLGRELRDDFGSIVPYVRQQLRRQLARLFVRLLLTLTVIGTITYASCTCKGSGGGTEWKWTDRQK